MLVFNKNNNHSSKTSNSIEETVNISDLNLDERTFVQLKVANLLPFNCTMENELTIHADMDDTIDEKLSRLNDNVIGINNVLSSLHHKTFDFVKEVEIR